MKHFNDDLGANNRYKNELMEHMRRQTKSLERIAQLLEDEKSVKKPTPKPVLKPTPKKNSKSKGGD